VKLGALSLFERIHANSKPTGGVLIAALHWQWSLTWRWILTWHPSVKTMLVAGHRQPRFYWIRHRGAGLNFMAGARIPLLGDFSIHTQPNMRRREGAICP
jgi:hypothetical protein